MKKSEDSVRAVVKLMIRTLNQMGVTLMNIDVRDESIPVFYVEINVDKIIQPVEETLKGAYQILWTLVNGKVTDSNKNDKIDLQYNLVDNSGSKVDQEVK